jgi:predicted tellurium resistance membrane protein TerC
MSGTKYYIRVFMAMIGIMLTVTGLVSNQFLGGGFIAGYIFLVIGIVLIVIPAYWWFKDSQKGP